MATDSLMPLVSIVTPVRNGAAYLEETIQSVLQQDYPNLEHVIIDDGSNDDGATVGILRRYPHLRWWSRENKGVVPTVNEGLAAARGAIVGFIAADDKYKTPDTVSAVVNLWQECPDLGCIYGRLLYIDTKGLPYFPRQIEKHPAPPWAPSVLRYLYFMPLPSLFVSRELVIQENLWLDATLCLTSDWDWAIRLSKTGCKFGYLNQYLGMHRLHAGQLSGDKARMRAEHREICRRYGTNYRLSQAFAVYAGYRNAFVRAVWTLRTYGLKYLITDIADRLRYARPSRR